MVGLPPEIPSFFDGIPAGELAALLESVERRRYPAGTVVIAEGEQCRELYIIHSGAADVFVAGRAGVEQLVGQADAGATLGEMSLFTGKPAAGTVRAVEDLDLLVVSAVDFERLCSTFPQVYRNLGVMLSERLALTNRLALGEEPGRLTLLEDAGAPPLLAYALASSVAWHTRTSTLLVVVTDDPPDALEALANRAAHGSGGARVLLVPPREQYAPEALARTARELCTRHEHVLLSIPAATSPDVAASRTVRLGGPSGDDRRGSTGTYRVQAWKAADGRVGPSPDGVVAVPQLQPPDEAALRRGLLPSTTPTGKALGWVARDVAGLKVGVALGAGSIRGFAHWGALRVLERAGLPIDYLAGSSAGAAAAGLYASQPSIEDGIEVFRELASVLFRPTVPVRSLLSSRGVGKLLRSVMGDRLIEDLPIPLGLVAADLLTRREVVLRRGPLWKAVLASGSIPGVYPAQRSGPYALVDGGVVNPVPTAVVGAMGADTIIGIQLVTRPDTADPDAAMLEETSAPSTSAVATILRSIEIMQNRIAAEPTEGTSILITPELKDIPSSKLRRFSVGLRFVDDGEVAAEAALPRIAAALPWLRSEPPADGVSTAGS
jgi:NTE family protein